MSGNFENMNSGPGTVTTPEVKAKTKKPHMYRVFLLNDDYTPMDFVIRVLQRYFSKSEQEAEIITLLVHTKGVGECGVFTYEVAETKVTQVLNYAKKYQHPLQCVMERK